jgi:hypothetical protein
MPTNPGFPAKSRAGAGFAWQMRHNAWMTFQMFSLFFSALRRLALPALFLLHLPGWANTQQASQPMNCESLRSEIEAKIRARGVSQPSVTVVDAQAQAAGQVVGSCERGSKKIIYRPSASAAQPAPTTTPSALPSAAASAPKASASATPAAKKPAARVITECADGRVLSSGDCSK